MTKDLVLKSRDVIGCVPGIASTQGYDSSIVMNEAD